MQKILLSLPSALLLCIAQSSCALADQYNSAGNPGDYQHTTNLTSQQTNSNGRTILTNTQTGVNNPTTTTQLGGIFGGVTRNGLPETTMDSFVYEAGGDADLIYGDEGTDDIPPYFEFDKSHRIERGITGLREQALTTGHSEFLPDAWGGDEWTGNEWDTSGNGVAYVPPYGGGLNFGGQGMKPEVPNLITSNEPISGAPGSDDAAENGGINATQGLQISVGNSGF
ncbi:MAG TPA: hypothetical protein V6C81_19065 [Planktothrix sp.]|jgi:hypothetical protein